MKKSVSKSSKVVISQIIGLLTKVKTLISKVPIADVSEIPLFDIGENQVIKLISIDELEIDHAYQRQPTLSKVDTIASEFEFNALGIFQVCQRAISGIYYVTDAQHRLAAIKMRKNSGQWYPKFVLCLVNLETNQKQEAKLFVKQNNVKPVTRNNKFKANLLAGEKPEVDINQIIVNNGFQLDLEVTAANKGDSTISNGIRNVAKLYPTYTDFPREFATTLGMLAVIFTKNNSLFPRQLRTGEFIYSFAQFLSSQKKHPCIKGKSPKALATYMAEQGVDFLSVWRHTQQDPSVLKCRQNHFSKFGDYLVARLYMDDDKYNEFRENQSVSLEEDGDSK